MLGNTWQRIGPLIQKKREERGVSQRSLAESAGVGVSTLHDIETGKSSPRIDTLEALCSVLNLTPTELWGEPRASVALSPSAIPGPPSYSDCAVILMRLEKVTPGRRAIVLAWLFDDEDLLPEDSAPELAGFLHETEKSS